MDLQQVYDKYGDKLSPPYTREDILKDESLRAYLEDVVCRTLMEIAHIKYSRGVEMSKFNFEIDGRMKTTKVSVMTRTDRKIRLNPDIFTHSSWETIKLLEEAVNITDIK